MKHINNIPETNLNSQNLNPAIKKSIVIIGITGSTGENVLRLALEHGYAVTAIVRNPEKIKYEADIKVVKGDVTNLESLITAFRGVDSVISCFGPSAHKKAGNLMSEGMANIIKSCQINNVRGLVFMSGFLQTEYQELSNGAKLIIPLLRFYYRKAYVDKQQAEIYIKQSTVDWTIIRAPGLNNSAEKGAYRAEIKSKVHFGFMAYADCAKCLVDAIEEKKWYRQIVKLSAL